MPAPSIDLYPVILSGGAGTRLWPVSRQMHPKPFIRMPDGQSLLQKAFLRAASLPGVKEMLTVTNRELFFITEDEYRDINTNALPLSFLLEPFGRNTAPAIALAALHFDQSQSDAVLLVLPSDHLITNQEAFAQAVEEAAALAKAGNIVTFGIQPTRVETGYGYIEADGHKVKRFIEKPSFENASQYFESGNYLWNSGMFCFTAKTMLEELRQHAPELLESAEASYQKARKAAGEGLTSLELDPETFGAAPDISIDYAVIEKSEKVAVVACDIGWNDIGSWKAFSEIQPSDDAGNQIMGRAQIHDVANCFIQSDGRMIGAVGVTDLVIIDTADAVLVASKERAQDVKQIVGQLKASEDEVHKLHRTVHRPWGTYTVLEEGPRFKIKRILVKPGASLSLQMHHQRSEHWVVVSGQALVVNGDHEFTLNANESTYIPAEHQHRLANPGDKDLVIIEVQCGDYLGEDDIVRFDDHYGRS